MRLFVWLVTAFSWSVLKKIGASFLSALTIAVTLFGYLIFFGSFSDGVYTFDFGDWSGVVMSTGQQHEFMRLKLTYVGLAIVGFTTIVFRICCPPEIAQFASESDFIESAISTSYDAAYARQLTEARDSMRWYDAAIPGRAELSAVEVSSSRSNSAPGGDRNRRIPHRRSDWLEKNLDGLNALFAVQYQTANYSLFVVRFILLLGFASGLLLTLIPSVQTFSTIFTEVIASLRN